MIKFRAGKTSHLASLYYPHHSEEHLRSGNDLINIIIAVDDITDKLSPKEMKEVANCVMDALRFPQKARPQGEHPLGEVHRSFWSRALNTASKTSASRFLESYDAFMTSLVDECADRDSNTIRRSIDDYLSLRRSTGGIKPSFDLLLLPLEIPEDLLEHAVIKELETIALDMIVVANDVISFNVEQTRGEIHNLVVVLMNERNFTIQEAMDFIGEWYHARGKAFIDTMGRLPTAADADASANLQKYVVSLGNGVTGNYEWSLDTERYFDNAQERENIRKKWTVELMQRRDKVTAAS